MSNTLRTILILLIIWWVLRLVTRAGGKRNVRSGTRWSDDTGRPRGDVRIERLKDERNEGGGPPRGNVTDADFEELK